jgi:hypothetical protein
VSHLPRLIRDLNVVIAPGREMPDHEWRYEHPILMMSDHLDANEQLDAFTEAMRAILRPGSVDGITY